MGGTARARAVGILRHAEERDAEKGGTGHRSTRELADACDVSIGRMREALWRAVAMGDVEVYEEKPNRTLWKIKATADG